MNFLQDILKSKSKIFLIFSLLMVLTLGTIFAINLSPEEFQAQIRIGDDPTGMSKLIRSEAVALGFDNNKMRDNTVTYINEVLTLNKRGIIVYANDINSIRAKFYDSNAKPLFKPYSYNCLFSNFTFRSHVFDCLMLSMGRSTSAALFAQESLKTRDFIAALDSYINIKQKKLNDINIYIIQRYYLPYKQGFN